MARGIYSVTTVNLYWFSEALRNSRYRVTLAKGLTFFLFFLAGLSLLSLSRNLRAKKIPKNRETICSRTSAETASIMFKTTLQTADGNKSKTSDVNYCYIG